MDELLQRIHPKWFRRVAKMTLDRPTFEWIDSGSRDGSSPSADLHAYHRWRLLPRVLVDVSEVDLSTTVAQQRIELPIMISPLGLQRALHPDGEIGMARATAAAGSAMVVSANSSIPIEEIACAAPGAQLWLQLANWSDRDSTAALIRRAEAAGVSAFVPLVNGPVAAAHVDPQAGFRLPAGVAPAHSPATPGMSASLGFDYIGWLASITTLPIVAKGVMHPDDAARAVQAGASGIIVSNHGCRQLPRAMGALDALPHVVDAVGSDAEVFVDGGVRTGSDVLVALALGARAVMLGRPMAFALAVGGAAGVERALATLRAELVEAAALSGIPNLREARCDLLAHVNERHEP